MSTALRSSGDGSALGATRRLPWWLLLAATAIGVTARALGWVTSFDAVLMVVIASAVAAVGAYAQRRTESILSAEIARREQAEVEARAADRAKSRFLANISHELRTPLTTVMGAADLMLAGDPPPDLRPHLEVLETAAEALGALIDDVLDFIKLETGRLRFEAVDFRLHGLVGEVRHLMAPRAREKDLVLEVAIDDRLPDAVRGDPKRLRQVLLNLAGNAVKFTAEGQIEIRVEPTEDSGAGQRRLRFAVRDTGIGIAPEQQSRVFETFYQADSSAARRAGGSGLGLAIVKELVEGMEGTIGLESERGVGSTFFFELPLVPARGDVAVPASTREAGSARPADRARYRVLVVDDHAVNRRLARAQLAALGYRAVEAADGAEALARLGAQRVDAVLMDCQMPELDGYETARRWRRREAELEVPRIPIVAVTAYAHESERARCLAVGMDDYFAKPYRQAELAALIDCWLGIARPAEDTAASAAPSPSSLLAERLDTLRSEGERKGRDVLGETVAEYLRRGHAHLAALREARDAGDRVKLATEAHAMAGSSGMMGDEALAGDAARLHELAREEAGNEILADALEALEAAFARFEAALELYR